MSRTILSDTVKYLPAKVIPGIVSMLSVPLYTRVLPPSEYGQFVLTLSAVTMIGALCFSGINSSILRFHVLYGVQALHSFLRPKLLLATFIGWMLWILVAWTLHFPLQHISILFAGGIWIATQGQYEYLLSWFRSRRFAARFSAAISWRSLAGLSLSAIIARYGKLNSETLVIALAAAMAIGVPVLRRRALTVGKENGIGKSPLDAQAIARYGIPAALINLVTICLSNADRLLINRIVGVEAVAVYSASYDLAEKTIFSANSLFLLSTSVIGFKVFEKNGEAAAVAFLETLSRLYLLVAPPFVTFLWASARPIVAWLLPVSYSQGAIVVGVVAMSALLVGIMHRYSLLLSFHKRTDLIFRSSLVALVTNLVTCGLLIPSYGIAGAVAGTGFAYGIWLVSVRIAAARYQVPRFPWTTAIRVAVASIIEWTAIRYILRFTTEGGPAMLVGALIAGLAAYSVTLLFVREISLADMQAIWRSLGKTGTVTTN
jgi:O-antigen/teichoic acid export membrane protein